MFGKMHKRDAGLVIILMIFTILVLVASSFGARQFVSQMLTEQAEREAIKWGNFVRENLSDIDATFSYGKISEEDQELISLVAQAGGVFRYKFFNQDGIIVLASRLDDLGKKNTKPYFSSVVQQGGNYVKIEEDESFVELSDTGRTATVAEAYVPLMEGGRFKGAIEVYVDNTVQAARLQDEVTEAQLGLLGLLAFLVVSSGIVIINNIRARNRELTTITRAHESMARAEEQVAKLNQDLETRVQERTAEAEAANERISRLNQELEQRVEERTQQLLKANDSITKVNEAMTKLNEQLEQRVEERTSQLHTANESVRKLNQDLERRVEERTTELHSANERITRLNQDLEQRVEERTQEITLANENITKLNQELEQRVDERTAELREAQGELLRSERLAALGQLTATVSHELRNPLGAIRTAIYLISGRTKDQGLGVESALERADRSITRCDNIITELLDFTRQTDLALESAAFDQWLERVIDEQNAPEGVIIRNELATPGLEVPFDDDRLRRVIINLFSNACEAMAEDAENGNTDKNHALTISTRTVDNRLEVLFRDNGPGIAPEALQKIWEPLFSTKSFGVGLGLPTVRQIMEQHEGGIEITSQLGQGTSVLLWLPINRADERAA